MSAYNESDHPRDPLGKFRDKPGASGASGVSLSAESTTQRMVGVIASINDGSWKDQEVPLDMSGREAVSYRSTVRGDVTEGHVFDDQNREIATFTKRRVARRDGNSEEVVLKTKATKIGHRDDGFHTHDYAHYQGALLTKSSSLRPEAEEADYTLTFASDGTGRDPAELCKRPDGSYDYYVDDDSGTYQQMDQADVDNCFGSDCPFHSSRDVDQFFDDNTAFLKGESDTYHGSF